MPVIVAVAYFGVSAPHNFLPRWFVNTFQKMRNEDGEELKTTEKTEYLFNRELAESGIDNDNLADIMTWVCPGDDVTAKGMVASRFRCMIGMPQYFDYDSPADVETVDLDRILNLKSSPFYRRMRQKIEDIFGSESESKEKIDWESPAGVAYKEALVLSPLAKRFSMTRVIHETDRIHIMYGFVAAFLGTEFAIYLYKKSIENMTAAEKRVYRSRYLIATWAIGFTLWYFGCKIRNNFFEQTADVAAASYGPDLAKGGIEFYDKMLARNVALRELLGKEGEKRFTPQGELRNCFSNWIRNFNLPVYHRTIMSRRKTVARTLEEIEELSYEELAHYLEAQRVRRKPRKTLLMPMKSLTNWKNEEAEELDRSAGVIEYDAKLLEAFTKR